MDEFDDMLSDPAFRDVREVEAEHVKQLKGAIATYKQAIRLADSLLQLANQPAYAAFVQTLKDMREHRVAQLLTARSDREDRVLAGRCQELGAILGLMQDTAARRDGLAQACQMQENELAQLLSRIPQSEAT